MFFTIQFLSCLNEPPWNICKHSNPSMVKMTWSQNCSLYFCLTIKRNNPKALSQNKCSHLKHSSFMWRFCSVSASQGSHEKQVTSHHRIFRLTLSASASHRAQSEAHGKVIAHSKSLEQMGHHHYHLWSMKKGHQEKSNEGRKKELDPIAFARF